MYRNKKKIVNVSARNSAFDEGIENKKPNLITGNLLGIGNCKQIVCPSVETSCMRRVEHQHTGLDMERKIER